MIIQAVSQRNCLRSSNCLDRQYVLFEQALKIFENKIIENIAAVISYVSFSCEVGNGPNLLKTLASTLKHKAFSCNYDYPHLTVEFLCCVLETINH